MFETRTYTKPVPKFKASDAQQMVEEAITVLRETVRNRNAPTAVRVEAAALLLEYATPSLPRGEESDAN